MRINYLGATERNCSKGGNRGNRFAQISCNDTECNKMVEALQHCIVKWDYDVFGEGVNDNTIYVKVDDIADYNIFKKWYKEIKKTY